MFRTIWVFAQSLDCVAHSQNRAISRLRHNTCAIYELCLYAQQANMIYCVACRMEDILNKRHLPLWEAYCYLEKWVMLCIDEQQQRSRSRSKFACRSYLTTVSLYATHYWFSWVRSSVYYCVSDSWNIPLLKLSTNFCAYYWSISGTQRVPTLPAL